MDAALPLATLLILWPSLLPGWRAMLIGTLLMSLALAILYFIVLGRLDHAFGGEGPTFFVVVLLYGLAQMLLAATCLARVAAGAAMAWLSPPRRASCRRALRWTMSIAAGVTAMAALIHRIPAGLALSIGSLMLWLYIATALPRPIADRRSVDGTEA
ncbi:hypothetical protein [Pseudoxanthomonas sp.]|jgi:hypothetical protein|uniref:hypothetical protein n=1 Tax=Pseudoxanthomonas sp. TaxID=1871049 RepID=UPI002E157797|nr:hypothetical protein [Pseudoxanthomonas sp.]